MVTSMLPPTGLWSWTCAYALKVMAPSKLRLLEGITKLFRGEFHWLYFTAKQFHIDNTALISEKGLEEVQIPEQT